MSRRAPSTLADYLVVAVSPALIMLLVGSLMFFLIEVFYQGQYPLRLQFVMAMFVMAIVCIARISMEEGAGYAALFGAPLAAVTALALSRFVQIEGALAAVSLPINLGLMALVWWAAHKLTWDCTLIDDTADASGQGLLQEMGLDPNGASEGGSGPPGTSPARHLEATTSDNPSTALPWWQRLLEADRRPHAPGVWVVYFSLAALPLFGIGGWFIPASATEVRQRAMLFLIVYVASGLTLLVSTSFLGLRRYLRQRALEMPIEMAATWVGLGLTMIAAMLAVCYVLPRPDSLRSIAELPITISSPDRQANRVAVGPEGTSKQAGHQSSSAATPQTGQTAQQPGSAESAPNQNEGQGGGQVGQSRQSNAGKASQNASQSGDSGSQPQGDRSTNGQDQPGSGQEKGGQQTERGGGSGKSKADSAQQDSAGKPNESSPSTSQDSSAREKPNSDKPMGGPQNGSSSPQPAPAQQQPQQASAPQAPPQSSAAERAQNPPSSARQPSSNPPARISIQWAGVLPWLLRVLLFAVVVIAAVWLAWRYRRELAAAWHKLLAELRELWDRLFGRQRASDVAAAGQPPAGPVYRSFASFADPFATGAAARMPWPELVRYTFQALEAWGRERGCSRASGQTPHEFAMSLAIAQPQLQRWLPTLADAYGQIAYAPARASAATIEPLQQLWRALRSQPTPHNTIA